MRERRLAWGGNVHTCQASRALCTAAICRRKKSAPAAGLYTVCNPGPSDGLVLLGFDNTTAPRGST